MNLAVRPLTRGPLAHFFGYYDKPPWDRSGRYALAVEAEDHARLPGPGEKAGIVVVECATGKVERLAETTAWNWQQGCMLQWLPPDEERTVIFNDCVDGQHVAVILDIHTGARRVLPRPIYCVSRDGRFALSVSFARLARQRPVVGYAGGDDPFANQLAPADDGVWRIDLATGAARLVLSLAAAVQFQTRASMAGVPHRFEHVTLNPVGSRFFVLHRWKRTVPGADFGGRRDFFDRLVTAATSGGDLHLLADEEFVSHFDWRDDTHILAWAQRAPVGRRFWLFTDQTHAATVVGEGVLTDDGHCSYSPDRRWVLGDSYSANRAGRRVWLYDVAANRCVDIAELASPPPFDKGDIRCDLHPRWSRDGRQVCVDSTHEGTRQMYVIDVNSVVG